MKLDVIVNRQARRLGPDSPLRAAIAVAASRAGAALHETRDLRELDGVARDIAARGTDVVVLAGGDGSTMAGLSALARAFGSGREPRLPAVALVPGGTVCTVARALGAARSRGWIARVLSAASASGAATHAQPTLRVDDGGGADRIGFVFGAGLVAGFFDDYYADGAQGRIAAAGMAARVAAGALVGSALARRVLGRVGCAIEVDGAAQVGRAWSLVLASVLRDVGLHIRATYRAGAEAGRFHVVASGRSPRGLAAELPRVLVGWPMRGEPRVDALARSLRVMFDEPGAYVLDGDVMHARELAVSPGPVVRLIVP